MLPLCVNYNNFLRLRSVQRQVVSSCPRLDVVNLSRPRVSVVGRDDEVRVIGKLAEFIAESSHLKIACIDHV